jgi:pimeloyl-ACP methyl ester carboxylesterase
MNKQKIELNGATVAYRDSGRGIPVVLVHANISDMRSWEPDRAAAGCAFSSHQLQPSVRLSKRAHRRRHR